MTITLNLFEQLLERASRHQRCGQAVSALTVLRKLSAFHELPGSVAGEVHARKGEIHLRRHRYRQARRHLIIALRHRPGSARLHFLLGLAYHHDPAGDQERGLAHYRRALKLSPGVVRCLCEAGLLSVRLGGTERGLKYLRRAARLAPSESGVVGKLVEGLQLAGLPEEALLTVRHALFTRPRCSKLRQLWVRVQLTRLRQQQATHLAEAGDEGPRIIPFLRPVSDETPPGVRHDEPASLPGPHLVRIRARARRRMS